MRAAQPQPNPLPLDTVLAGNCLDQLAALPDRSVDLIFADPPYNLQLQQELRRPNMTLVDAVDDAWDQFRDFAAYDRFTRDWLTACRRVLKDTGTLWVIGSYHNIYRVGTVLQDLGYWILNDVTWIKCLAGETRVLVRNAAGWVHERTLAQLATGPSQPLEILGPYGWRQLVAVAHSQTLKPKVELKAGYTSQITASADHLIPIWRNNYGTKILEKPLSEIAQESAQTYLLHIDITPYLEGTYTTLDVPAIMEAAEVPLYVYGGYQQYKETHPYGTWATDLKRRYDYPDLHWYLTKGHLPVSIAQAEGVPLENLASHYTKNHESFPASLVLTPDWAFLIGLYLAEGSMNKQTQVRFSLHSKEVAIADRLEHLLRPYGVPVFRHQSASKPNVLHVYFGSNIVRTIIRHFVQGDDARTKSLVMDRLLNTSLAFRRALLDAYLAGDGHYEPENDRYTVGIASQQLVKDLQLLAHSVGFYATVGQNSVYLKATDKRYNVYNLKIYRRKSQRMAKGDFHPVRATTTTTGEYSADWYDLVVEDGLFLVERGIVVHNSNPMPNFRGVRFTNAHETLLWCKKNQNQKRYTFNHHQMKSLNDDKQMRSDWEIPICTGGERLRVNGEKAHPTQKPEALLHRVILSSSNPGDVILDPFFGTGTTGAVAKRLGRHWIGIEQDLHYVNLAEERIAAVPQPLFLDEAFVFENKRSAPRVAFATLVERGLLPIGTRLYFARPGHTGLRLAPDGSADLPSAVVRADGSLISGLLTGSIHKVGAALGGQPACNGWEQWYFAAPDGTLHAINELREQVRAEDAGTPR